MTTQLKNFKVEDERMANFLKASLESRFSQYDFTVTRERDVFLGEDRLVLRGAYVGRQKQTIPQINATLVAMNSWVEGFLDGYGRGKDESA